MTELTWLIWPCPRRLTGDPQDRVSPRVSLPEPHGKPHRAASFGVEKGREFSFPLCYWRFIPISCLDPFPLFLAAGTPTLGLVFTQPVWKQRGTWLLGVGDKLSKVDPPAGQGAKVPLRPGQCMGSGSDDFPGDTLSFESVLPQAPLLLGGNHSLQLEREETRPLARRGRADTPAISK